MRDEWSKTHDGLLARHATHLSRLQDEFASEVAVSSYGLVAKLDSLSQRLELQQLSLDTQDEFVISMTQNMRLFTEVCVH